MAPLKIDAIPTKHYFWQPYKVNDDQIHKEIYGACKVTNSTNIVSYWLKPVPLNEAESVSEFVVEQWRSTKSSVLSPGGAAATSVVAIKGCAVTDEVKEGTSFVEVSLVTGWVQGEPTTGRHSKRQWT